MYNFHNGTSKSEGTYCDDDNDDDDDDDDNIKSVDKDDGREEAREEEILSPIAGGTEVLETAARLASGAMT